ncbi:unnamed protein product [Mytilus coruscus]|uniref:Uncharacterized protein n=1 Tax=Mytilus coruscus TaxID=42192 RepID=A0A6J8EVG6_MYTCO|nr:unnamed protein product [Mytilus coruscus]
MRHNFTWRTGDECVSLEKYVKVYTRNPAELYEAVKKRAIEEEVEEDDYEENLLYEEEIKASQIGIDKTTIESNLRVLDDIIREEENANSAQKQVHTRDAEEHIDGTTDKKTRAEEENENIIKDFSIKRKNDNEVRFRFSLLHGTTTIPSRIPVMVWIFNGEKLFNKRLNNEHTNGYKTRERPRVNSKRRIPVRVLRITNTNRATLTGLLAGNVWNTDESARCEEKRRIDETRRLLAPISRIPIPKNKIRRSSDCIILRLDPNEHLPKIFQGISNRDDQVKNLEANQNRVSHIPISISEKGERICPGLASEFLQLPS